ncbi:hypothetical protein N431DRAFT_372589 [Stipitochalara longipes BDJ]|nr:hypothetical protein N431DRAFT_372589 [Stipitochalara longipes BDJ]
MSTSELDAVRAGDDAPMPISPSSPSMSRPSGLHINPEPGDEYHTVQSPTSYDPGENSRRVSLPSTSRQGSMSYQGNTSQGNRPQIWDVHISDLQYSEDAPYINHANRPVLARRQSSTSHSNMPQIESRGTQPEVGRQSIASASNSVGQDRRTSHTQNTNRRESIVEEIQPADDNTRATNNFTGSGSTTMGPIHELGTSETSSERVKNPWWRRRLSLTRDDPKQTRWFYIFFFLTIGFFIGLIVALVLYFKLKGNSVTGAPMLKATILPQPSILPIADSNIGAAQVVIGTYFSTTASGVLQTKLVYNGGNGQICIRTESSNEWSNVQCLDGANPRADTPLTVLDWLGGPSIYFITTDNLLSGIDHMPVNDTWKFSTLRDQKRPTHPQSQLSSVTWFNGTSSWLYYQDINSQLREFGLDDYRDVVWRDGSVGPLGLALTGTGIGTSRWWLLSDGSEVLEVFVQVSGGALHGRVYYESAWTSDFYAVDGTPNTVSEGAPLTSTVIHQPNATMVLLTYVASNGFLTVQSRGTANGTNTVFHAFSAPENVIQGDGSSTTGIAAFDAQGKPMIYLMKNNHVLEISAPDVAAKNWSSVDITAA